MSEKGTEQATPQRRKKAREEGDTVRSRDLLSAVALMGGVLALGGVSGQFIKGWTRAYTDSLSAFAIDDLSGQRGLDVVRRMLLPVLVPMAIIMGSAFAGSLITGIAQGGGIGLHFKMLAFKFDRLNPVTNLGNLFSLRSTTRVLKSLVPAGAMVFFGWHALSALMLTMPVMSVLRLPETFSTAYTLAFQAALVTLAWSGLDYAIEWRAWNERLKMTKQEIRDEMRDATGNPQIKARVRQIQRAMRRRRMKADISRASVLITNPTHYAVALEFSFETMQAPTVLAKGRDLHALEMREQARWAGVPIVENPPLARSLYQSVEEGHSIPFELYQAVAGILAFLYRQKVEEKMRADRERQRQQERAARRAAVASNFRNRDRAGREYRPPNFTTWDQSTGDESTPRESARGVRTVHQASPNDDGLWSEEVPGPGVTPLLAAPPVEGSGESAGGVM
jgi:flagellar biosynthetic protein FlhB